MATVINADPGIAIAFAKGVPTQSPAAARDPDLDLFFDCDDYDDNDNPCWGLAYAIASGSAPFVDFLATGTARAVASGSPIWGGTYAGAATAFALAYGDLVLERPSSNWVQWSKIGYLDFTIEKDNVAGKRPLDWKGWVYQTKKLGNRVVVYGENGVSVLTPQGVNWGLQTIYRIGLKGKNAIAGTDSIHYFVDREGQLWSLTEGLTKLDYSEYLASMFSMLVLTYDESSDLLYVCDGAQGFVYRNGSLGKGPINVSGLGYQSGSLYVTAPATIVTRIPELCTDIFDMGTRKGKTIFSLEFGTDLTTVLYASIDYRRNKAVAFSQSPWYGVSEGGKVFITAFGREFRVRAKTLAYEYFEIDSIKICGIIHVS